MLSGILPLPNCQEVFNVTIVSLNKLRRTVSSLSKTPGEDDGGYSKIKRGHE